MPRLPVVSGREAVRIFELAGWAFVRQAGSHMTLTKSGVRVVWIDVQGDRAALISLAGIVDRSLIKLGYPGEKRPLSPHLTLARVKDRVPAPRRRNIHRLVEERADTDLPGFTVGRISLIRSILHPEGAQYKSLEVFALGGAGSP